MMILLLENHKYCFKFSTGLERGRESIQKYCFGSKWFLIILVKKKNQNPVSLLPSECPVPLP